MREDLGPVFKSDRRNHVRIQDSWFQDWNITDYLPSRLEPYLQSNSVPSGVVHVVIQVSALMPRKIGLRLWQSS
jgi:hypothetical protein